MEAENYINQKIEIYLSYDFLTTDQYSAILTATNNVYKSIAINSFFGNLNYYNLPFAVTYPIPLCIEEVNTGNSISTKFSLENRFFPKVTIENGDTINIALPKWTAIVILSGMVISYGVDKYEKFLDIRIKQLELDEKTKVALIEESKNLQEIKGSTNNSTYSELQQNYYLFQTQIQKPNIKKAEINGNNIINPDN